MILTRRNALRGLFLAAPAIALGIVIAKQPREPLTIVMRGENGQYYSYDAATGRPLDTVADYRALSNA